MGQIQNAAPGNRVAILSSHQGGHLQTLVEDPVVRPWIALVVADRPDAYALKHAEWHGIPSAAFRVGKSDLNLYDAALARLLADHEIDYVVVAGFPRIVGVATVRAYEGRIARVHHSLLPEFPGPDPVAEALEHGAAQTGVTVHLIEQDLEVGPILAREPVDIGDGDTWHTLVERLHHLEIQVLPSAVRALVERTYLTT